jgi:glutathione S-transferase
MTTTPTPTSTIVVHHLDHSRSHRILWLLEELGLPYALKVYQRDKALRAPPTLRAVHPLGHAPVLEIDGVVFAESGAIIETVVERFGTGSGLRPEPSASAFIQWRYFMHYAEGSLMPPLLVGLITGRLRTAPLPFFVKPILKGVADQVDAAYTRGEIDNHTAFLEGHLASRAYFCGDTFTAADIQMVYGVTALVERGGVPAPRCAAWLKRVNERPAAMRALAKGGPMMPPGTA